MLQRFILLILTFTLFSINRTPIIAQDTCPGNLPPRLIVGDQGQVTPGDSNNVRAEPSTSAELVGKIPGGEVFDVLDGYVCADGYTWWEVAYLEVIGWTPEGSASDYWVQPYTPAEPLSVITPVSRDEEFAVNHAGISFSFDMSLAEDVLYEWLPAAYGMGGSIPSHHEFTFVGFRDSDSDESRPSIIPRIAIFPLATLIELWDTGAEDIVTLQTLLEEQPDAVDDEIPVFARFGAKQMLRAQVEYLTFTGGRGVRFLTFYAQDSLPVDNQSLRYIFAGITDDEQYYVMLDFPLDASILPDESDLTTFNRETAEAGYPDYLTETIEALNTLPDREYRPNLIVPDDLVMSLQILRQVQ